jgi:hypothetical protein
VGSGDPLHASMSAAATKKASAVRLAVMCRGVRRDVGVSVARLTLRRVTLSA